MLDNFDDGNFTNAPTWVGDAAQWEVIGGRLHLNIQPAVAAISHMSTPSTVINDATWEFNVELTAATAVANNYVDVFLTSNQADLEANPTSPAGYYVRINNTNKEISLYYRTTTTITPIITGNNLVPVALPIVLKVKVVHALNGDWTLFANVGYTGYNQVGVPTAHTALTPAAHFGVLSRTTAAARNTWCYFDSIYVTPNPDVTPPQLLSATATSGTVVELTFDEKMSVATGQNISNYLLNGVTAPLTAQIQGPDSARVWLTFATPFTQCATQTIAASNIADRSGNVLVSASRTFSYVPVSTPNFKSVVISEIMADPTTPSPVCLPALEYLELHNRSSAAVNLQGWTISDGGTAVVIVNSSYPLCPGEYVLLTTDTTVYPGVTKKLDVTSFPSLNNAGDPLGLRSNLGALVDSVVYDLTWYQDPVKDDGGWSIELINAGDTCSGASNWIASTAACGGTPGAQNSVFSTVADTTTPRLLSVTVTSTSTIDVCFTEAVDAAYATIATNYIINNGIGNPLSATMNGASCVTLSLATPISTGVLYTITATGLQDCLGNSAPSSLDFIQTGPGYFKAVIFNEIMFDPDSALTNMPPVEFVEVHNRSNSIFDLGGWTFEDATSTVFLSSKIVLPGDYLILCKSTDTAWFSGLNYHGITTWPSLNNTGDALTIRDFNGTLIDFVEYTTATYGDPAKANGGWSIELINPSDTCSLLGNWIASQDPDGGTPGVQNSVFNAAPDLTGPQITSVSVTGSNTIELCFNETMSGASLSNPALYTVNNGIGVATSATALGSSNACVTLVFASPFASGTLYTLTATGVQDCKGNSSTITSDFLLSGPATARAVIFTEIYADPDTIPAAMGLAEFVEVHNRSTSIFDLGGWTFSDASTTSTLSNYILSPGAYVVICKASDTAWFSGLPYATVSTMPSLNNTGDQLGLRDQLGNFVDTVSYDISWYQDPIKDDGGWTLELINPNDTCSLLGNWIASQDANGGTPGAQNSVFNSTADITPPQITSLAVVSANVLELCFDETMDAGLLVTLGNYSVNNGIGAPSTAVASGPAGECVTLTFPGAFVTGTLYTLTASNFADCKGNAGSGSADFLLSGPAFAEDVIINEIFADPDTAATNMPEVEFIELHNRSTNIYNLAGWTFSDPSTSVSLGNHVLMPGGYVVLCKSGNEGFFPGVPVLGLSTLPSLNNTGDALGLRDNSGSLVDTVDYDISWYQDVIKDDGGWSLELINPDDICSLLGNWIASNDPDGGTPGIQNSVYNVTADTSGPEIASIAITSIFSLQVCFTETMELAALGNASNYSVDNGLGGPAAVIPGGAGGDCVELLFSTAIDTGTIYTITINGLADCVGNPAGILTDSFVQGGSASPYQIVINEIFADESPVVGTLPEAEYVELYNAGTTVVDLSNWVITDRRDNGTLDNFTLLPGRHVIVCASGDVSDFQAFGDVVGVSGMPGLNNSGDSLELYDANGILIDFVYYLDDWYHDETKDGGGYSLERLDPTFTCPNGNNWSASNDPNGGTPGQANSIGATFTDNEGPALVSAYLLSPTVVRLFFDELMQESPLLNTNNFTVDNGVGHPVSTSPLGSNPFGVDITLGAPLDTNRIYCVTVTTVRDCPGNTIGTGNSVCFGIPVMPLAGDVIINEILFNPYTGGADFVELYNNSDKIIDLSVVNLGEIFEDTDSIFNGDEVTFFPRLLLPGTYVALTPDRQFQIDTYLPPFPENIFEMSSFPSFDDDEGKCVIYSDSGVVLDRLDYLDDWQFPNLDDKEGVSLERHNFDRPTQDPDNWHSAASVDLYATPGYVNSQVLDGGDQEEVWLLPETFSPDQDGFDDVLSINYHFETSGWNARVTIFDNKGRQVVRLQENTLLGTDQGTFTWDGINAAGAKTDVGVYVVYFEATMPTTGEKRAYKLGVVLAANFK